MHDTDGIADGIRAHHGTPDAHDLADVATHGIMLTRFVDDLGEALDQMAVAGLAHPDPDLPDALSALADRSRALGLGAATLGLDTLRQAIDAVRAAAPVGEMAPVETTRAAFEAAQRLIAWRRLFARAAALQRVEGRLTREALEARGERAPRPRPATASMRIWPLGFELHGESLRITGVDLATGRRASIRDHLSEVDGDDPFSRPVISRLFQARVALRRVVDEVIEFTDHPVGRHRGGPAFAPAFRALPRRLAPVEQHVEPTLPEADARDLADLRRPMRADLRIEQTLEGVTLGDRDGEPVEFEMTPALELNALKRLILASEGDPATCAHLSTVVGPGRAHPQILSARDDLGARVFPAYDPGVFTLDPATLYQRAMDATDGMSDGIEARFVRTIAALFGGAADDAINQLADDWRAPGDDLDSIWLGALARGHLHSIGDPAADDAEEHVIDEVLLLASMPADDIPRSDLAALFGRPPSRGEGLDGQSIHRALWLLFTGGPERVGPRRSALLSAFAARYGGELHDPTPFDIAARALMLAELSREAAEHEVDAGEEPLTDDEILEPARSFFTAHLDDLSPGPGQPAPPLPDFTELRALADCHRHLWPDARPDGLQALPIPRMALARAVAGALLDLHRRPLRAAQALLCAADAGIARWFVG